MILKFNSSRHKGARSFFQTLKLFETQMKVVALQLEKDGEKVETLVLVRGGSLLHGNYLTTPPSSVFHIISHFSEETA